MTNSTMPRAWFKKACELEPSAKNILGDFAFLDTISTYAAGYRYPDASANLPTLNRVTIEKIMALTEHCFQQLANMII